MPTKAAPKLPVATPNPQAPEEPPDFAAFMEQVNPTISDAEPPIEGADVEVSYVPPQLTVQPYEPRQHTAIGVGALAEMTDDEFERNLAALVKGQERLTKLHQTLMVAGVDYGTVPGIPRPFLHKPGAEKLAHFYGLVLRFEADRLFGEYIATTDTDGKPIKEWVSPPLAYHVRAYAHLGSFDGPVVAQGYGEANVWEEKHRYRNERPTCPQCGREDLIKRVQPEALKGKWQCPSWKGGCGTIYAAGDPAIKTVGKVENENPYDLANTLIKMAEKRAATDVVLRATNTSGLYSQDEDSPSVQAQSAGAAPGPEVPSEEPTIESIAVPATKSRAGASEAQINELARISREKDLGPDRISDIIQRVVGVKFDLPDGDRKTKSLALLGALNGLLADDLGKVIVALTDGEVPEQQPLPEAE